MKKTSIMYPQATRTLKMKLWILKLTRKSGWKMSISQLALAGSKGVDELCDLYFYFCNLVTYVAVLNVVIVYMSIELTL